jgi:hypothetical protein
MSAYNQEFNKDNTILRYVMVATLAELRNKVYYYNQIDEDTLQKINIPFYYSVTGNERFLMDNFIYDAAADGKAYGDYEVVPRGVLQLSSISIDSGSQTNKFVRGEFVREWNGLLKTFSLETNFLPLTMTFSITVICSNNLEMLKATESILSKLYKTTLFNVDLGIMRIQASMAVPEDFSQDRLFEFALNDKKEFNVTFDLEVKSFVPVFENGILLNEIAELTRAAMESNPNAEGVGLFRCGADGNVGIYFGGVFQKFEYTVDNLAKVAPESIISNQQYVNPNDINRGGPYIESETTSAGFNPDTKKYTDTETEASKEYRNAQDDEG